MTGDRVTRERGPRNDEPGYDALTVKSPPEASEDAWRVSPILGVPDVRYAAEYYRDVLGFTLDPGGIVQPTRGEPGGVYAIVKRSGVWIHLQIRRGEMPPRTRQAFERDVYLYVKDLDAVHEDLLRRGARVLQPPSVAPYGIREIEVEDLNAYRLTFGEILS